MLRNKEPPKILLSSFSIGDLLLDPTHKKWSVFPLRLPWRKLTFSFASVSLLEIDSGLGMRHVFTSFSAKFPPGPDLCRPCAYCQSLCAHTCTRLLITVRLNGSQLYRKEQKIQIQAP